MINKIKCLDLFCDLDDGVLSEHMTSGNITLKEYEENYTLYETKDNCNSLDIVIGGALVAYSLSENGNIINMFEFKEDSLICANLLFGQSDKYPFNIYCLSKCTVIHIHKNAILEFLKNYEFTLTFIKNLSLNSGVMNRKITTLTEKFKGRRHYYN